MECYSVKMTTRTRPDRRQAMADQTRRDILHTARELFARQGYAATSVTDIAREAGVAVQTIYARLGSKRGMLTRPTDVCFPAKADWRPNAPPQICNSTPYPNVLLVARKR